MVVNIQFHQNIPRQPVGTGYHIEQKVGKIRKVLHFENEIEHKILVTYVIAKVSSCYNKLVFIGTKDPS
ncbi:hypothetical protein FGF63_09305 [Neisseria meningitidis]|nr:hypothetical protein [Neisseria meningitidis]